MALQKCALNLNNTSKELQPHGTIEFPCAGYSSRHTCKEEDIIPWHWHEEMEIIYMEYGYMKIKIPSKSFFLKEGDCLVINANMLHHAVAAPECRLRSLVFSPALIIGNDDFVFAKKYMRPLLSCHSFSGCYVDKERNKDVGIWFNRAFEALEKETYGFEFIVRENLSRICLFLHREYEAHTEVDLPLQQDNLRIKKMFDYIHKNYSENLSLADIAKEVNISKRECLRCFKNTIQISPIQYLLKYRVMQGAELLLNNPTASIAEIAGLCGFNSQSNFAKTFKRFYTCSPREYRIQHRI